jgi:hypothetical protein
MLLPPDAPELLLTDTAVIAVTVPFVLPILPIQLEASTLALVDDAAGLDAPDPAVKFHFAVSDGTKVRTVIGCVANVVPQLLVDVYVIVVEPSDAAVTTPVALTVAMAGLALTHVPLVAVSLRVVVAPLNKVDTPLIGETTGVVITLMLLETVVVPQVLVTA